MTTARGFTSAMRLCLAAAVVGYLTRPATLAQRVLLAAAALLLITQGLLTDLIGLGLLTLAVGLQRLRRPGAPAPA